MGSFDDDSIANTLALAAFVVVVALATMLACELLRDPDQLHPPQDPNEVRSHHPT